MDKINYLCYHNTQKIRVNHEDIMKNLVQKALHSYENADLSIKLKARFMLYMCLTILVIIPVIIAYTSYLHLNNREYNYSLNYAILIPEYIAFFLLTFITAALIRGYFIQAAHALLIMAFSTMWFVMFVDASAVISRLDTIVLIVALLSLVPLTVSKTGTAVYIYGTANVVMMYGFMFYIRDTLTIPINSFMDYLADNTIAFIFITIASANILKINNASLAMAENFNLQLKLKNQELEATNEELEATNEELNGTLEEMEATNEEFEAQNRELVLSQEELSASREELLAVFDGSHDAFIILDESGRILEVNRRTLELFQTSREEALSKNIEDFSPRKVDITQRKTAWQRVQNGETFIFEWKGRRFKDGSFIDIEVDLNRLKRRGTSVMLAGIRDISARKQFESAIIESERKYRLITENSTDLVFTMDLDFQFTYVSPSVETILGYTVETAMTMPFNRIFTPASLNLVAKAVSKTREMINSITIDRITEIELEMYRNDGTAIWTRNKFSFLKDESGTPIGITGVTSDITDRKKAERERELIHNQLVQAQKMEAVGTLAGGIAHDFNNILGGIMGSLNLLELLMEREDDDSREKMKSYMETAVKSTRRAADLTKQLLTMSRKSDPQPSPMDINRSLGNVLKICKNSFPKSVELYFRLPEEAINVHGDPAQIEQVFLNLCLNASHAMTIMRPEGERHGGTLKLTADIIYSDTVLLSRHPDAVQDARYARISISDNGIGMSNDIKKRVFEPFYTTKNRSEGTGLGLAMVYGIMQQHRGFIDIYSSTGSGSTFTVYFPIMEGGAGKPLEQSGHQTLLKGSGLIMVIDDEQAMRKVAGDILEQCGYGVIIAENGNDAVRLFESKRNTIVAVLLDLSMPGMSGLEVYEKFKSINPEIKVILTSGFMENDIIKLADDMGISGFLRKPYTALELSSILNKILTPA